MLFVADFLEPLGQEQGGIFSPFGMAGAELQIVYIAAEFVQAAQGLAAESCSQRGGKQGFEQAELVLAGIHAQRAQGLVADAALGRGDGAHKGRVVIVIRPEAKPGAQVADFGAVKKALAARYLVGDVGLAQGFLEGFGLVVGAVQHGKVAELTVLLAVARDGAIGAQALDTRHGALGLVLFAVGVHHAHRLAFTQVAPQVLGEQLGVGADHIVGSTQNGRGGAVVLLQLDDLQGRKIHRQLAQVVQGGAAPAVDALVIIADGGEAGNVRRFSHQQFQHRVLRGIGVLVLVHQHMAHLRLPAVPHLGVVLQELQGQADQVVKVHALVGRQALLIVAHDNGGLALSIVAGGGQGLLGIQAGALPAADGPLPLASGVGVHRATGVFQDAGDVIGVQNREGRLEAQRCAVLAQHAHAQRMEGADQHVLGRLANQALGALAHLGGGLVGKGNGGNALGRHASLDQARNLVRDHPRLAGPSAGQHQAGAVQIVHSILLGQVHTGGGGRHAGGRQTKRRRLILTAGRF